MTITRESWLTNAAAPLARLIEATGEKMPELVRYSCGWPSKGGTGKKKRTIGQCWDGKCSKDKTYEIFVSPTVADVVSVLAIQLHEMIHAAVGLEHGHKKAFKRVAVAVGLEGKMTATVAGKDLTLKLKEIAATLGDYPHAKLDGRNSGPPKQSTRLIKCGCVCGYVIRTTRKWIDEVGLPVCACGQEFNEDGDDAYDDN